MVKKNERRKRNERRKKIKGLERTLRIQILENR
jgi:hypothetical protein